MRWRWLNRSTWQKDLAHIRRRGESDATEKSTEKAIEKAIEKAKETGDPQNDSQNDA